MVIAAQTTKFQPAILLVCRFHACFPPALLGPGGEPGPAGMTGFTPKRGWRVSGRLTCRDGAPKTRHQFKPISAETRHSRESFDG
jgi:hypothetical protein